MKRALILINVVNDFFLPKGVLYVGPQAKKIIPFAVGVLDEFRKNRETVLFISDAHQSEDREFKIYPKHSMRDSAGAQILETVLPVPGEYQITKRCYSGAFSTPMADVLKRNYVTDVYLMGALASVDVMETGASLFYHGFNLLAYRKGLADLKPNDLSASLKRMQKIFNLKII